MTDQPSERATYAASEIGDELGLCHEDRPYLAQMLDRFAAEAVKEEREENVRLRELLQRANAIVAFAAVYEHAYGPLGPDQTTDPGWEGIGTLMEEIEEALGGGEEKGDG